MAGNLYPQPSSLVEKEGSGRLSFAEDSASGTRQAVVDASQLFDAVRFLMGIVYVDSSGNEYRLGADQWPGLPLRCVSVDVEPHGEMLNADWQTGPAYAKALLNLKYEAPKFKEEEDGENNTDPEDVTFMIQDLDYSCEILTVPMVVGIGDLEDRVEGKRNIRLPMCTYTLTIPKVKLPKWNLFQDYVGTVNEFEIFGGAPETVLFDGPKAGRTVTLLGDKAWQVVLKMVHNKHGWNNTLNPDTLLWEPARDKLTGLVPPYEVNDLRLLFI